MATWTTTWTLRCAAWASSSENTTPTPTSLSAARRPPSASRPSLRCAALQDWPRRSHPASSLTVPQHRRALFRRTPQLSAAPFLLSTFPSRSCRRRRRRPAPFLHAITVPLYGVPSAYLANSSTLVCRRRLCPPPSPPSPPPPTPSPSLPTHQFTGHSPLTRHAPCPHTLRVAHGLLCNSLLCPLPSHTCMIQEASRASCLLLESGAAVPECTLQHPIAFGHGATLPTQIGPSASHLVRRLSSVSPNVVPTLVLLNHGDSPRLRIRPLAAAVAAAAATSTSASA
jgi:hypothetical protein